MNTIDSVEMNEDLVIIWNAIEDRAKEKAVREYAKMKRETLTELLESKKDNDRIKKTLDEKYAKLVNEEIKEVKSYQKKKGLI